VATLEQQNPKTRFQGADLAAHGSLGHVQLDCS